MPRYWAGIDWSERHGHEIAVVDAAGSVIARGRIPETPDGVKELLRLLGPGVNSSHRHSRKRVPVAIETSRGLLVEALRGAGQPVVALNPAMAARYRGRLNPAKRKDDAGDARMLANILRIDGDQHRPLWTPSPRAAALKQLTRAHLRALRDQRYYANRLRSHLTDYYPAALQAWATLPTNLLRAEARAVLAAAPTPATATRLRRSQLAAILAGAGRTRQIDDHAARLHTLFRVQQLRQPLQVEEAMGHSMLAVLAMLNQSTALVESLADQLTEAFQAHEQAPIYRSFPGVGPIIGARLLAEIGDDPTRFATAKGLCAYAGAAPITWASGGSHGVTQRHIANRVLKVTGHHWAFASLTRSPGCRAYYDRRRERGDRYAAALRNLYGRLLRCLHHCLATGTLYREEQAFRAPRELAATSPAPGLPIGKTCPLTGGG
ncbi:IS110 family transposase [Spirillospora sp. CA-294931]|uniref:IS110 family transposase n=1 Tax=Spirillospora sp. CA-294931 TaxID=3240042 RepID=UPI003D9044E0